jgi:hypothetical protein
VKFIGLTRHDYDKGKVRIAEDHIVAWGLAPGAVERTAVFTVCGNIFYVRETPDEIDQMWLTGHQT